jgi:hypothetical protein
MFMIAYTKNGIALRLHQQVLSYTGGGMYMMQYLKVVSFFELTNRSYLTRVVVCL